MKYTFEQIKSNIESTGYKLLSDRYLYSYLKLNIQCPENHIFCMTYNNFQQGQRCPVCQKKICNEKLRFSYETVKNFIESVNDYKLISTKYINAISKLKIKCPSGHIFEMSYDVFKSGHRCSVCTKNKKFSFDDVKNFIESIKGYKLISTKYVNARTKLDIQCPNNHIFKTAYYNFKIGVRCRICRKGGFYSEEEKVILNHIKSIYNGSVIENDRTQLVNPRTGRNLELDIWLPEINKAIEYNGEYWHSFENKIVIDLEKRKQCCDKGIQLLVIEESKWLKNKNWLVINRFVTK